jgi:hypothetical protein
VVLNSDEKEKVMNDQTNTNNTQKGSQYGTQSQTGSGINKNNQKGQQGQNVKKNGGDTNTAGQLSGSSSTQDTSSK